MKLVDQVIDSGIDSVYLATSATLLLAPLFKRRGLRVVLHVHESWNSIEQRLFSYLLSAVDIVIAVSSDVASKIPGKSIVIYNGFPDTGLKSLSKLNTSGTLDFLVASRWSAWKGHDDLLQAWSMLERTNVKLTILGSPPPSGKSIDVPALIRKFNLEDSVNIIGQTQDVDRYIQMSDVVLVPSSKPDPLPTIAIEAARSGRPVIASRLGGLPEIVEDGVTGWLISPRNISEWASTIDSISLQHIQKRGANARRRYLECFSENRFRDDLRAALGIPNPDSSR